MTSLRVFSDALPHGEFGFSANFWPETRTDGLGFHALASAALDGCISPWTSGRPRLLLCAAFHVGLFESFVEAPELSPLDVGMYPWAAAETGPLFVDSLGWALAPGRGGDGDDPHSPAGRRFYGAQARPFGNRASSADVPKSGSAPPSEPLKTPARTNFENGKWEHERRDIHMKGGAISIPNVREIFEQHADFVWRVLSRAGVRESDLGDAAQEVFMVVANKLDQFDGQSKVATWLYGITIRVAANHRRKVQRKREDLTDEPPEITRGSNPELPRESPSKKNMARILEELVPEQRLVFELFELEEMTCQAIADAHRNPAGNRLYAFASCTGRGHGQGEKTRRR